MAKFSETLALIIFSSKKHMEWKWHHTARKHKKVIDSRKMTLQRLSIKNP